jgi:hypothetical protein
MAEFDPIQGDSSSANDPKVAAPSSDKPYEVSMGTEDTNDQDAPKFARHGRT